MRNDRSAFRVAASDIGFAFDGLSRPECVIATATSGIFVSHSPVGVLHIAPDGRRRLYGRETPPGSRLFSPNGIALTSDRRLLIASTGSEGGVWQVTPDGDCRPFLMEVDGQPLYPANFVLADALGRIWITVSTRQTPSIKAYNPAVADGFIVLCDRAGARIVADGLGYTNECRLSNDGTQLYVNETFGRRISRFPLRADGTLGARETFARLGAGDYPDGGTFDEQGGYWITNVVSNRIYRFDPSGEPSLVFADTDEAYVAEIEQAYLTGSLTVELLSRATGAAFDHLSSITFAGEDMRTVYVGALKADRLPTFRSPVAGARPAHLHWKF